MTTNCPSGKRCFDTKRHAKNAAKRVRRAAGRRFRVYACRHCGAWHLTSKKAQRRPELMSSAEAARVRGGQ